MRNILLISAALILTGCASLQNYVEATAIPDATVGLSEFTSVNNASSQTVDHAAFDQFLGKYLVTTAANNPVTQGASLIRYQEVSTTDSQALIDYIDRLQNTAVSDLNRNEQLAFWINLYNAETIRVILENVPVASIRDIQTSVFDVKGPWNDIRLNVEGTDLALEDIENKIVRPIYQDARIHYGLNCAAIGCPNLLGEAYTADNLERNLEAQARAFINNPRGVKIENGELTLSRIFLWYESDYGETKDDILVHIRQYALPDLTDNLTGITSITRYEYDWSINDAARIDP